MREESGRSGICRRSVALIWTVLALLAAGLAVPASVRADAADDAYLLATGHHKLGRLELAEEAYREFLKTYPTHPKVPFARLYLGEVLVNARKYQPAREEFRTYVKAYPNSKNLADAMYRVAECSLFLDDLKAAETEFEAFLKADPRHPRVEWALPYLADVQYRLKKYDEAEKTFRQAIEQFPQGRMVEDAKFGLARTYESRQDYDKAIALYKELANDRTGSRAAEAQVSLGARYYEAGDFAAAATAYSLVSERFPESPLVPAAHLNAGYAFYQLGDFRRAVERFDLAARQESQRLLATYWKGVSLKSDGDIAGGAKLLQEVYEADPKGELASEALYQWALAEYRRPDLTRARELFLAVVEQFPEIEAADESLHLAGEAAWMAGDLDEARRLAARFEEEYPRSSLLMSHELLRGRILESEGGEKNLQAAARHFERVVKESGIPRTQSLARYGLARVEQKLGNDARVLEVIAPVVEGVKKDQQNSEFIDSLVLAAASQFATGKHADAVESTSLFLKLRPQGPQDEQALSLRARARAQLKQKEEAQADLRQLLERHAESSVVPPTLNYVAEAAYAQKEWAWAADVFGKLAELDPPVENRPFALSGLAWSLFEQKKYEEAAATFGRLLKEYPREIPLAPEAAFKQGEALQLAGDQKGAAEVWLQALERFGPDQPAKTGDEETGAGLYAYRSGLYAARALRERKDIDAADAAYARLVEKFPKPKRLAEMLDEWAVLNYEAERYDRADEIFRKLVAEAPDSDLADNAKLSLAESDLIAGELDRATETFTTLQADPKSDAQVQEVSLKHLIGLSAEREDWKKTANFAGELIKRFPDSGFLPFAKFQQGHAQLNLNELEAAEKTLSALKADFLQMVEGEEAWIPQIWVLLADTYFRLKQYDNVLATVNELRARDPEGPLLYQTDEILGRSYKNQAQFEKAREAFERVVNSETGRRTETAAKSQFLLAETYLIQKDYKNAQKEYFKVYHLYKFPEWQAPALYQAALCDEALQQWKNAAKLYEDLIKEFPESEFAAKSKPRLQTARKQAGL